MTRPKIAAAEKRSALMLLGRESNRDSLGELLARLSNPGPDEKLEGLLPGWEQAALKENLEEIRKLALSSAKPDIKNAALAVLLRLGEKAPGTGIAPALWVKAMPAAGRGKIDPGWHPVVVEMTDAGKPKGTRLLALSAITLFPAHDSESFGMLSKIAEESKAKDLQLSFAALDAMKRIPASARPEGQSAGGLTRIRISATGDLRFDPAEFSVPAGSAVELTFYNPDNLFHNLVVVQPDALERVGLAADMMAGSPDGAKKDFIPDDPGILHATPQLTIGSARSHVLRFFAPEKPGNYPYICTYPGHWRAMKGVMKVTAD
ncbi:MAG: hypothetical protein HKN23_00675 [Verrucomicrobiales bacterium]|nr:hypothetical protein [Verrucomicrobiales bacterium]